MALHSSTSSSSIMVAETPTKTDVSIPYDAAARLSYDEWRTKHGKGDFNSERFEAFKANYEAVTVANVIAARDARERSIANGQGAAIIFNSRVELNEYADMILQSSTSSSTTTAVETPKIDVSIPYDAAARLSYDEWRVKHGKGEFNAACFEAFKANYEAVTVANVIAARDARERSIVNGQGAAIISNNPVELNEYADMILQSSTSSSTTTAVETPKIDVSIPYDAAARLSYDEWRVKHGKGEFNAACFEAFKANYEAVTVANVIAARDARERSIVNGQGAAVISNNRVELNEYADMILQSSTSSSTTTAVETPKIDVSIPYDAVARLSYDEWRVKHGKGEFNAACFEAFKANYETVTVANVIAARDAREPSIVNGQGAAIISNNRVELNEYADMILQSSTSSSMTAANSAVSDLGLMIQRISDRVSHNGEMQVLDGELEEIGVDRTFDIDDKHSSFRASAADTTVNTDHREIEIMKNPNVAVSTEVQETLTNIVTTPKMPKSKEPWRMPTFVKEPSSPLPPFVLPEKAEVSRFIKSAFLPSPSIEILKSKDEYSLLECALASTTKSAIQTGKMVSFAAEAFLDVMTDQHVLYAAQNAAKTALESFCSTENILKSSGDTVSAAANALEVILKRAATAENAKNTLEAAAEVGQGLSAAVVAISLFGGKQLERLVEFAEEKLRQEVDAQREREAFKLAVAKEKLRQEVAAQREREAFELAVAEAERKAQKEKEKLEEEYHAAMKLVEEELAAVKLKPVRVMKLENEGTKVPLFFMQKV